MTDQNNKLLRVYEQQLDDHYTELDLWHFPRPEAIYGVLTVRDSLFALPMLKAMPPVSTGATAQLSKKSEDGVMQALQWLCPTKKPTIVRSTTDRKLIEAAHKFTLFAGEYVNIADFHKMYGSGESSVIIDPDQKIITFEPITGPGVSHTLAWHEQVQEQNRRGMQQALKIKPSESSRVKFIFNQIQYELIHGRIELESLPSDIVTTSGLIGSYLETADLLPIPKSSDLYGFTCSEFWKFIRAVHVWSHVAFSKYIQCILKGCEHNQCMPIQIISTDYFVEQVSRLGVLDTSIVNKILERLTYKASPKADPNLTPFFCSQNHVSWSPAIIMQMRHERNLLKIMARSPKPLCDHAATLIGSRDRHLGRLIGDKFSKRGYQFKLNTIISCGDDKTDLDVILYLHSKPTEVLLIEAKALLAPDEVGEVIDASKKMLLAQNQIETGIRILKNLTNELKSKLFKFINWNNITNYYGIVVTSDAEPHEPIDQRVTPVVSLNTMIWRFSNGDFRSPRRFHEACMTRPWLKHEIEEVRTTHTEVKVGELTYRLPARVMDCNADIVNNQIDRLIKHRQ